MKGFKWCLFLWLSFSFQIMLGQSRVKVYFDFDQHQLQSESEDMLLHWYQNYPNTEILEISGFCDSLGTVEYNLKLAKKRTLAVLNIFEKSGVALAKNFQTKIIGKDFEQNPIQAENRNVTIIYEKKKDVFEVGEKIKLEKLHFYGNSDVVLPNSRYVLNNLLDIMNAHPNLVIEIQGHICCEIIDYNKISSKRAKAVYDFLLKNGISKDRISHKGLGSSSPIHALPEQSEEERIMNRRVEIEIIKI
jgi:outer membrane protein OmpA-like peptidoglycan-associated protein